MNNKEQIRNIKKLIRKTEKHLEKISEKIQNEFDSMEDIKHYENNFPEIYEDLTCSQSQIEDLANDLHQNLKR